MSDDASEEARVGSWHCRRSRPSRSLRLRGPARCPPCEGQPLALELALEPRAVAAPGGGVDGERDGRGTVPSTPPAVGLGTGDLVRGCGSLEGPRECFLPVDNGPAHCFLSVPAASVAKRERTRRAPDRIRAPGPRRTGAIGARPGAAAGGPRARRAGLRACRRGHRQDPDDHPPGGSSGRHRLRGSGAHGDLHRPGRRGSCGRGLASWAPRGFRRAPSTRLRSASWVTSGRR